jgi:hypothetical protein
MASSPLWVNSVDIAMSETGPLCPQERPSRVVLQTDAMGYQQTCEKKKIASPGACY